MKILKYVINESGTPILFEMSILHCEIITSAISAGLVIIDYNILTDEFENILSIGNLYQSL